jgi:hypothetical protein
MEWKNISVFRIVLSIWLLGVCSVANAQNLVVNGEFEYSDTCLFQSISTPQGVAPWGQLYSSPDFFHPCFPAEWSVPSNLGGGGQPLLSRGYAGLYAFFEPHLDREFLVGLLSESLVSGVSYHAEFYVSMMDSVWYASRSIGAYFSEDTPPANLPSLLNLVPQMKYEGVQFLSNKQDWTKIEGSFTAQGGERYLTIGNFNTDGETDTVFVSGGGMFRPNQPSFWKTSYYYIDGVSVIPDSIYLGIDDIENEEVFNLYPNPNTGEFTIDHTVDEKDKVELNVWSISGQLVARQLLSNGQSIIRLDVSNGLYLYKLKVNGLPKWSGKISVYSE